MPPGNTIPLLGVGLLAGLLLGGGLRFGRSSRRLCQVQFLVAAAVLPSDQRPTSEFQQSCTVRDLPRRKGTELTVASSECKSLSKKPSRIACDPNYLQFNRNYSYVVGITHKTAGSWSYKQALGPISPPYDH